MEKREFIEQYVLNKLSTKEANTSYTSTNHGLEISVLKAYEEAEFIYDQLQLKLQAKGLINFQAIVSAH